MKSRPFLDKAREASRAARLLLDSGCLNCAANRSYYAAFHAARAALVAAGLAGPQQIWSHQGLQAQVQLLTRRRKVYPARIPADLARLREVRHVADYHFEMVRSRDARDAVRTAAGFVELVEKEIDS